MMIFQGGFGSTARSLFLGILGQETPTVPPPVTPPATPPAVVTPTPTPPAVVTPAAIPAEEPPAVVVVTPTFTPVVTPTPAPTPTVPKRSLRRWAEVAQAHFESIMNSAVVPFMNRSRFRSTFRAGEVLKVARLRKRDPAFPQAGGCRGAVPVWTADFEAIKDFLISQATPEMKAALARDKTANTRTAFRRAARAAMDEYCIWHTKGSPEKYEAEQAARPAYPQTGAAYEKHLASQAAWILERGSGSEYEWGIKPERKAAKIADAAEYQHRTSKYNIPLSEWQRKITEVAADYDFYLGMSRPAALAKMRSLRASKERYIKKVFDKHFKASIDKRAANLKAGRFTAVSQSALDGYIKNAARVAIRATEDDPNLIETRPGGFLKDTFIYYMRQYMDRMTYERLISETITPAHYEPLGATLFKKRGITIRVPLPVVTSVAPGEAEELARRAANPSVFWIEAKQAGIQRTQAPYYTEWGERRLRLVRLVLEDAKYRSLIDRVVRAEKAYIKAHFMAEEKKVFNPGLIPDAVWRAAAEAIATDQNVFSKSAAYPVAVTPAEVTPAAPPAEKRRLTTAGVSNIVLKHIELGRRAGRIKRVKRGRRWLWEMTAEGYKKIIEDSVREIVAWLQGLSGLRGFGQVTPTATPTIDPAMIAQIAAGVEAALKQMGVVVAGEVTPTVTPVPTVILTPTITPVEITPAVRPVAITPVITPVPTPPLPPPTPVPTPPAIRYDTREDVMRRAIQIVFSRHGIPRAAPGTYPVMYLSSIKRNELIGDLVYESQKLGGAAMIPQKAIYGGYPGLTRAEVEAILLDRNILLERPAEITPRYITPPVTPAEITPVIPPEPTPALPTLDEWARAAPVFPDYAVCAAAARAATGRVPDRYFHCMCIEDAVTRAVDNALEAGEVTTKAITPDKYAAVVADAINVGNQMVAQRTYTPTIAGRRVAFPRRR